MKYCDAVIEMSPTLREFETLLLLAIGELGDEAYGLAIHERLEAMTGRTIALGQIYTGLGRLEQRDFVCAEEGESTRGRGGRPKKYYRLAPPALEVLRASADSYARLAGLIGDALPRLQGER
jgi:DNA-binding PadR family transcriptional regulator